MFFFSPFFPNRPGYGGMLCDEGKFQNENGTSKQYRLMHSLCFDYFSLLQNWTIANWMRAHVKMMENVRQLLKTKVHSNANVHLVIVAKIAKLHRHKCIHRRIQLAQWFGQVKCQSLSHRWSQWIPRKHHRVPSKLVKRTMKSTTRRNDGFCRFE